MMLRRKSCHTGLLSLLVSIWILSPASGGAAEKHRISGGDVHVVVTADGTVTDLATGPDGRHAWLAGPLRWSIRNEASGAAAVAAGGTAAADGTGVTITRRLPETALECVEKWSPTAEGLTWDLEFRGDGPRAGHELCIELPALTAERSVFTAGERGVMSVAGHRDYSAFPYGATGWDAGRYCVLPLVSVFDTRADAALTVALPPEPPIPHLQIEWSDAATLRLRLGHRAMGGGRPAAVRLLLYAHPADSRAVLRVYSDAFPRHFRPALPRGSCEGAFWYHHIHEHPPLDEMARQNIRWLWSSFWFTHLGEYLPDAPEWKPYTYARWWNLGETMSDAKIRAFIRRMHEHGICTFAYFNVTEYGGAGGGSGDAAEADRLLRERFADALIRNERDEPIPTWEGGVAMNCSPRYSLFPVLQEQLRRHLERLPEIDGFAIDRLDWAGLYDYAHADGLTMIGDREVTTMAGPVAEGVAEVCRQAHAAGKRVFVNQFWRIEMLKDVDGYCHEYGYARGLGYLAPLRPVCAWHYPQPYKDDLLAFEAALKLRLQNAVFPQMIAREFPISQQAPDPEAAGLLEIYAPLFEPLNGKEQVLEPHCVAVDGPNDVNLFRNARGHWVVPVTSRISFLSRAPVVAPDTQAVIRVPQAAGITWAHVYSADAAPYRAAPRPADGGMAVPLSGHATASVIVAGGDPEPPLDAGPAERLAKLRAALFGSPASAPARADHPAISGAAAAELVVRGMHLGPDGPVTVSVDARVAGTLSGGTTRLPLEGLSLHPSDRPPVVQLTTADEGTWFFPEEIRCEVRTADGKTVTIAAWAPANGCSPDSRPGDIRMPLIWLQR